MSAMTIDQLPTYGGVLDADVYTLVRARGVTYKVPSDSFGGSSPSGAGVPTGGTTGQLLVKTSDVDYETDWTSLDKNSIGLGNVDNTSNATERAATATLTNKTLTSPSIDGTGTNFTGTAQRITGDFSNGTVANRLMFQTSTANGHTVIHAVPNGTSQSATFSAESRSTDHANGYAGQLQCDGTKVSLIATARGAVAGTPIPMGFFTNNTERMRIDASGNVGIGVTPLVRLHTLAINAGTPEATGAGTSGVSARFGNAVVNLDFGTYSNGSCFIQPRLVGDNSYNFGLVLNPNGGVVNFGPGGAVSLGGAIGYGSGAGGTVTQVTSKGTGVTLNKPNGTITMHNASLAAGSAVTFIVNNSTVGAFDGVLLNQCAGYTNFNSYDIKAEAVLPGGFYITVKNIFGAALSEALIISFKVIKGSNT